MPVHNEPRYVQCPSCRKVILDPHGELGRLDQPTPCCGASGEHRILWPSPETYDILGIARNQELATSQGRRIAIVFLASALEILFENVLWELLAAHGSSTSISELVLDGYQGRERRTTLFKNLSGKSVSEVLKNGRLETFHTDWTKLAKARNEIVHQYYYERTPEMQALIKRVVDRCFKAFAELHNYAVTCVAKSSPVLEATTEPEPNH